MLGNSRGRIRVSIFANNTTILMQFHKVVLEFSTFGVSTVSMKSMVIMVINVSMVGMVNVVRMVNVENDSD